jgi:Domain of unknown function (DUF1707)
MAEPGEEIAAGSGSRGQLRASHADREQVIGTLKTAFVAGMLAKDEFDLRVGRTLASRTYADLAALTADLPAGLAAALPPMPTWARSGQPVLRTGPVVTVATVLYAGALASASFAHSGVPGVLVGVGSFVYLFVLSIVAGVAAENRRDKRSGGQLPPGQATVADPAFRRLPPARPGGQLPSADPGHRHTEAARRCRPWPPLPVRGRCAGGTLAVGTAAPP